MVSGTGGENRSRPPLRTWLLNRPRGHKRALLVVADLVLLFAALWVSISIRYGVLFVPEGREQWALLAIAPILTIACLWRIGVYRIVTRFIGRRGITQIFLAVALSVLIWALLVFMSGQFGVPRSVIISYGILGTLLISLSRTAVALGLESVGVRIPTVDIEASVKRNAVIYGAGKLGIELLTSVRAARDRRIVGFIEPSPTMWGQYVSGVRVFAPERLARLIERDKVSEVLVALQGPLVKERRRILRDLESYKIDVKILPSYEDLSSGRVGINDLRRVDVGDLLGRDPVEPNLDLLGRNTKDKAILVTGAGGSIGSELVRQILLQKPRLLVLFESSEVALYQISTEVDAILDAQQAKGIAKPGVKGILGSVLDEQHVAEVIAQYGIQTIYHAAAYKHVPIVEHNPIAGLRNNSFGARVVARAARRFGVELCVLISTDKAVRPTNVMGASKRLAELVLQAEAAIPGKTVFTMVRFGNVLDSSGSVVRRFRDQIKVGGPVTVTHPEITRYFMSIPEAAELVIQAGAMAAGGEVFALHMGEPIKIDDLARLMVHLSGLSVRDSTNPGGDIEIAYTGLRPGEKLYEELLIGANTSTTEHPRIFKSDEPFLSAELLNGELDRLWAAMNARDGATIGDVLSRTVEGYHLSDDVIAEGLPQRNEWSINPVTLH